ncbi:hypothetical protein ACFOVU_23335 [Nocardiopsis sediminis]|uniref:ATP-binding protein n=1 Tax=Nocardiopsis sediminis TaxID=1778267 RepID=A0ABV8FRT3_9ACTN
MMVVQAPKVRTSDRRFRGESEIADARAWLTALLPIRSGIPEDTAAAAVLCLSEVATSAVVRAGAADLSVSLGGSWLYVECRAAVEPASVGAPSPDTGQQGYTTALVEAFTNEWGRLPDGRGVYFYLHWS